MYKKVFKWLGKGKKGRSTLESDAHSCPPRKKTQQEEDSSSLDSSSDEDKPPPSHKSHKKGSYSNNGIPPRAPPSNATNQLNVNVIRSKGTHIGNVINISPQSNGCAGGFYSKNSHSEDTSSTTESTEEQVPPDILNRAFKKKESITENDIFTIKHYISKGWKKMGKGLGYTEARLNQFEMKYKPFEEVIHQLLLDWMRNNNSAVGVLCTVLWESQEYEAAECLASLHD